MVTTRSKAKAAAAVSATPSSPTILVKPELHSPLQSPEPPSPRLRKRKRTRASSDSPKPQKLRRRDTTPLAAPRPQAPDWLPEFIAGPDSDLPSPPQSPADSDIETDGEDESQDIGNPTSDPKLFAQNFEAKDWSDASGRAGLEFFQAFPHDKHSTLCVRHLLLLAEEWYWKRKPTVNAQLNSMLKDGVRSKPDFSDLALPIREDTWTIKDVDSFKDDLANKISKAAKASDKEYGRLSLLTGHPPVCEIFDARAHVRCAWCARSQDLTPPPFYPHDTHFNMPNIFLGGMIQRKNDQVVKILQCGHETPITILGADEESAYTECEECGHQQEAEPGLFRPWKHAIKVSGARIPVEVAPSESMRMNSKFMHVDVGGIHIVVDHCTSEPLIRFRSTRFSQAYEQELFDYHEQGAIRILTNPGLGSHDGGNAVKEGLYWRQGAFNPTTSCTGSFENCACH
ncbi:uncharacterized protein B0J16DRAFT_380553 [Fusarium flagelliforme]|uniref:Uncharacterized protein n=1 Tax=Fusarium flagelliforme TaxID=2675880 RepID=A0A395MXQ3_9HYPO|nr:uncharacterized protein B0J16DRAFT_380553 [Fusarium flagelliforme]KAH7192666.1 hypothetical protein B0J16DRAFT_380553 [Fusarium flagelliforme]RFN52507.1 hypothetical protein FIE12Z_3268 [Fusarium flagelliforme]